MEGRPIDTIGYRGMHSYELALEDWWVPADDLIGGPEGSGRGFYLQMEGFENGRLQTAARAVGVMQAAYEAALDYAADRTVFGSTIGDYQLTQAKLGRMAVLIQAGRQFAYVVAPLMAKGRGATEASMVKAYVCKAAEWVTREAMQIHGGYRLRRGVHRQPAVRRRPRAVDLRGRRRDPLPEGDRPPPDIPRMRVPSLSGPFTIRVSDARRSAPDTRVGDPSVGGSALGPQLLGLLDHVGERLYPLDAEAWVVVVGVEQDRGATRRRWRPRRPSSLSPRRRRSAPAPPGREWTRARSKIAGSRSATPTRWLSTTHRTVVPRPAPTWHTADWPQARPRSAPTRSTPPQRHPGR